MPRTLHTLIALFLSLGLVTAACGDGETSATTTTTAATTTSTAVTTTTSAATTTAPATTTTEAVNETTALDVVLVTADDELNVRSDAGIDHEIVATLEPTESDVIATGREASVDGDTWYQVNVGGEQGWAHGQFLTTAVPHDVFASDQDVLATIGALTAAFEAGEGFDDLISPKDLWIAHFERPRGFPKEDLADMLAAERNFVWSGPACDDCIEAPLSEMVVADFLSVAKDPDVQITFDTHTTGVQSSADVPIEFENFRFVSLHKPASDNSLDWMTWNVYFDYVNGTPMVVGLSVDQYSP